MLINEISKLQKIKMPLFILKSKPILVKKKVTERFISKSTVLSKKDFAIAKLTFKVD